MDRSSPYFQQVALLVQLLPFIDTEPCFALKGGTAINLFVRALPRLSVDIDLVYLESGDREQALSGITEALDRIATRIENAMSGVGITRAYQDSQDALRLLVSAAGVTVKIELSPVLRGTVYPVVRRPVVDAVEEDFGFAEVQIVSEADLYAGKLCAALDRQHPRDFFDVMLLLRNEGLSEPLRKAFIVYLISHGRPMEELLEPRWKDIAGLFAAEFQGMTTEPVTIVELEAAIRDAQAKLLKTFTQDERRFIASLYDDTPEWHRLGVQGIEDLPAVRWKLININKMEVARRQASRQRLGEILGIG